MPKSRRTHRASLRFERLEDRALLAVLTVGPAGAFQTIQSAIDSARRDDVVEIAAGIYNESVDLSRMGVAVSGLPSNLVLRGESSETILRAPSGAAISNATGFAGDISIENFAIESPTAASDSFGIDLSAITGSVTVRTMTFRNIAATAITTDTITGRITVQSNTFLGTGTTDGSNSLHLQNLKGIGAVSHNDFTDVLGTALRIDQGSSTDSLLLVAENTIRGDANFLATTQRGITGSVSGNARLDLSLDRNTLENLGTQGIDLRIEGQAEVQTRWTRNVISEVAGEAALLLNLAGTANAAFGAVNNSILDAAGDGIHIIINDAARLNAVVEDNLLLGVGSNSTDVGFRLTTGSNATGEIAASFLSNDFDTISGDGLVLSPGNAVDATFSVVDNFFTGTNSVGGEAALVIRNADENSTNDIRALVSGNRLIDGIADAYHLQRQGGSFAIEGDQASATTQIESTNSGVGTSVLGNVSLVPLGTLLSATPRLLGDFIWRDENGNGVQDNEEPGVELITLTLRGTEQLSGGTIERQTLTNGAGAYLFSAVLPGEYSLSMLPPKGFVPTNRLAGDDQTIDSDFDLITATANVLLTTASDFALDGGLVPGFPWQNRNNALDVNNDSSVAPIDVLQIINELNSFGSHDLNFPTSLVKPPAYFDVNGDNFVSPVDALQVINYLNGLSAEGEFAGEVYVSKFFPPQRVLVNTSECPNENVSQTRLVLREFFSDEPQGVEPSGPFEHGRTSDSISSITCLRVQSKIEPLLDLLALDHLEQDIGTSSK
ncbi:MAG: hypothetical protein H6822_15740 [Planctomycetaceae bacterium]|nr:hypothetical protein [Planctomycetales bacterium]MCB9923632.1 hypothetical protein [Planctomycetaceae bacterium]